MDNVCESIMANSILIVDDEFAELVGVLLIELVPLHGREHGAENFRPHQVRERLAAAHVRG